MLNFNSEIPIALSYPFAGPCGFEMKIEYYLVLGIRKIALFLHVMTPLHPSHFTATSPRVSSELEQARPQTSGEEELQLQLALAMSREVAEQVSACVVEPVGSLPWCSWGRLPERMTHTQPCL